MTSKAAVLAYLHAVAARLTADGLAAASASYASGAPLLNQAAEVLRAAETVRWCGPEGEQP